MLSFILLIAFMLVPTVIATVLDGLLVGKFRVKRALTGLILYGAALNTFLFIMKMLRGAGMVAVVSSFNEVKSSVLYGVIVVAAAVILPVFVCRRVPKGVLDMFALLSAKPFICIAIAMSVALVASIGYHFAFAIGSDITVNHVIVCCSVFTVLCLLIPFITSMLKKNKVALDADTVCFKKRFVSAMLVTLAFVFSIIVFIPIETYLGNVVDFTFEFSDFWWIIAVEGVVLLIAMVITEMLFKGKAFNFVLAIVLGVTLAGYVQSMFLNGMMDTMTGEVETWTGTEAIVNLVIWIIVMLVPLAVCLLLNKFWNKVANFGSVLIVGMQVVALVSMVFTVQSPKIDTRLTTTGLYEVSGEKNVVIFVLDKFDQTYIDRMLKEYPDSMDGLRGFTYYPNATGSYCFTHVAVPYLLSGERIPEYDPTEAQLTEQIDSSEYFKYIVEHTGNIGVYTNEFCVKSPSARAEIDNCESVDYYLNPSVVSVAGLRSSLYRVLPFKLKQYFVYGSDSFNKAVQPINELTVFNNETHRTDATMIDVMQTNGLTVNENYGDVCFRMIHTKGTHEDQQLDFEGNFTEGVVSIEQTAAGELAMVSEYCAQLNKLGLYEDATIIVTADHGYAPIPQYAAEAAHNVNPIMFYKPAGVDYDHGLRTLNTPVSHDDIFATIIKEYGGDSSSFGKAFDEIAEDEERVRYFYWAIQDPDVTNDESAIHVEYKIVGDARDEANWSETGNRVYPNRSPKRQNNG